VQLNTSSHSRAAVDSTAVCGLYKCSSHSRAAVDSTADGAAGQHSSLRPVQVL